MCLCQSLSNCSHHILSPGVPSQNAGQEMEPAQTCVYPPTAHGVNGLRLIDTPNYVMEKRSQLHDKLACLDIHRLYCTCHVILVICTVL